MILRTFLIFCITLFSVSTVFSQEVPFDTCYSTDTFTLSYVHPDDVVIYEIKNVSVHVDFDQAYFTFKHWRKHYRQNGGFNWRRNPREALVDSIYKVLKHHRGETIRINHQEFEDLETICLLTIDELIKRNQCTITDSFGNVQNTIIRRRGSVWRGMKEGWVAYRYYILTASESFFTQTIWRS